MLKTIVLLLNINQLEFMPYLKSGVSKKTEALLNSLLSVKSSDRPQNICILKERLSAEESDTLPSLWDFIKDKVVDSLSVEEGGPFSFLWNFIKKILNFIIFFVWPALSIILFLSGDAEFSRINGFFSWLVMGLIIPVFGLIIGLALYGALLDPNASKQSFLTKIILVWILYNSESIIMPLFIPDFLKFLVCAVLYILYIFMYLGDYAFLIKYVCRLFKKNGLINEQDYFKLYIEKLSGSCDNNDY